MSKKIIKNTTKNELIEISKQLKEFSKSGKQYYLSMDTETTGLSPDFDRLTAIGAVILDEKFNKISEFEIYFDPFKDNKPLENRYKDSKAEEITKITTGFLKGKEPLLTTDTYISEPAKDFKELAELIAEIFNYPNIIKIAHNKKFDMRMLEGQFKASGRPDFTTSNQMWIDSQEIIKTHFKINEEDKKEQTQKLKEINKNKSPYEQITLNTLDSFDLFISDKIKEEKFKREIDNQEMHGALIDAIMLAEVLKKYDKKYHEIIETFVKKELENETYIEYAKKQKYKINAKENKKLISKNIKKNTLPILRTSASTTTNKDSVDAIISSIKTEELQEIFSQLVKNGNTKIVISDFTTVANMINIENEILKFNKKQKEENKPLIEITMGMSLFLKDEKGMKTEIDIIPKTSTDFKLITKIQELAFLNDEIEPYLSTEDLKKEIFKNFEIITNGYKDIFNKEENNFEEIKEFYKKIYKSFPNIKIGIFETLERINDNKFKIIEELKKEKINIEKIGTSPIIYTDIETHLIHEESSSKKGIKYHNKADFSKDKTTLFENKKELNIEFTKIENEETRFIPKDKVAIPNPFDYGLEFIKKEIPIIWNRVQKFKLIDETKSLKEQDIERITREYLEKMTEEGIENRAIKNNWTKEKLEENKKAIKKELEVINQMKFNGFTTFVQYLTEGELKGKGRGSAAGSVVSYALGITDIEPLENGLIFERYLNLLRKGFPDIDMDFADRNGVIEKKLAPFKKQDKDFAKYILTISTAGIKGAVAEVCKYMDANDLFKTGLLEDYKGNSSLSVYVSKKILGKYFDHPGTKLKDVLNNPDFQEFNEMYNNNEYIKKIVDLAGKREGIITGYGVHAAGVIFKTKEENYLNNGPIINNVKTTPIGGKIVEDYVGIKMDFLGLNSLKIIDEIKETILENIGEEEFKKINHVFDNYITEMLDDKGIIELLKDINMGHIFQYSSELMKKIIKKIQINEKDNALEILSMISAIGRPGVDSDVVINNRLDPENNMKLIKEFPELEPILEKTYGVPVYEEQIMSIFKEVAGFNMGEAGVAQKQIGKKKDLESLKKKFLDKRPDLERLFQHLLDNSGYSFNKSHSISYAVTSMMMMYLKANYKKEFFIGLLNNKMDNKDYIPSIITDMKKDFNNIDIKGTDINNSEIKTKEKNNNIYLGLGFIKGLNNEILEKIIKEREENGKYTTIENLIKRVGPKSKLKVTKKTLETLAYAGTFDSLNNKSPIEARKEIIEYIQMNVGRKPKEIKEISTTELLKEEYELTGGYLHLNHPLDNDKLKEDLKREGYKQIKNINLLKNPQNKYKFYASISDVNQRVSGKGNDIFIGKVVDEIGNEQSMLAMIKNLNETSIKALSQKDLPLKMECSIMIDENTGEKTAFINKAETIELEKYEKKKAKIQKKEETQIEEIEENLSPLQDLKKYGGSIKDIDLKIKTIKKVESSKGEMLFLTLEDGKEEIKAVMFNNQWEKCKIKEEIKQGKLINVNGYLKEDNNNNLQIVLNKIENSIEEEIIENKSEIEESEKTETKKETKLEIENGYLKITNLENKEIKNFLEEIISNFENKLIYKKNEKWYLKIENNGEFNKKDIKYMNEIKKSIENKLKIKAEKKETILIIKNEEIIIENISEEEILNKLKKVELGFNEIYFIEDNKISFKTINISEEDLSHNNEIIEKLKKRLNIKEIKKENILPEKNGIKLYKSLKNKVKNIYAIKGTTDINTIIIEETEPKEITKMKKNGFEKGVAANYLRKFEGNSQIKPMLFVLEEKEENLDTDKIYDFIQTLSKEASEIELIIIPNISNNSILSKVLKLKEGINKIKLGNKIKYIYKNQKEKEVDIKEVLKEIQNIKNQERRQSENKFKKQEV